MPSKLSSIVNSTRVAIYIRVSTTYQVDKDSLPMQKEDLTNYCRYVLNTSNFVVFEDAGYSAKNTDRPAYQQMMARIRSGEFSHLLVWKIDRISRNLVDFTNMYNELKMLGCTFVSKNEQFDTSTAIGEAVMKIIVVFAELERKMTSERVSAVMVSRATEGKWNGGRIPYGYDYDKATKSFTVNPDEEKVYQLIYRKYEETQSLLKTAKYLTDSGIRTRAGNNWTPTVICKIFNNPFYVGAYLYNVHDERMTGNAHNKHRKDEDEWVYVDDHHPAMIDKERFFRVKALLEQNRRSNKIPKTYSRKNVHVFAGLLFCGYCNELMHATQDRPRADGYRPSIYSCGAKRRYSNCQNKYINDFSVGNFVLNYVANIIKASNNIGKSTPIETFERKLLRGPAMENVRGIERQGLEEMFTMLRAGICGDAVFRPPANSDDSVAEERDLLLAEKRKNERALNRLNAILLYGDDGIAEKDFLMERKTIMDRIKATDDRLKVLDKSSKSGLQMSDAEFMQKASYFILEQQFQEKRSVNYEKFIRAIDPQIVRNFTKSVIQKIVVKDGKIMSIQFSNGIEHKFLYDG